jgi:hypothetical protein
MNDEEVDDDYEPEEQNDDGHEIRIINNRELEWDDMPLEIDVKK